MPLLLHSHDKLIRFFLRRACYLRGEADEGIREGVEFEFLVFLGTATLVKGKTTERVGAGFEKKQKKERGREGERERLNLGRATFLN